MAHVPRHWILLGFAFPLFPLTTKSPAGKFGASTSRNIILEHPSEIDLRKVDQLWFLDLLTNGLIIQGVPGELVWGVDLTGNRAAKVD